MKTKICLGICLFFLLPLTNNLNVNNSYSDVKGNNFSFKYHIETINTNYNYPFYKASECELVNNVTKLELTYNYPEINYINILCKQAFKNNELKEYKKEILYFVENLYFVDKTQLNFLINSGNSSKSEIDVDGKNNKFGYYLITINASIIKFQKMSVNFNIDNKIFDFELNYYLVDGVYSKVNVFETANEYKDFMNKYGL